MPWIIFSIAALGESTGVKGPASRVGEGGYKSFKPEIVVLLTVLSRVLSAVSSVTILGSTKLK